MGPRSRKAWLGVHITFTIAWFGALAGFVVLASTTVGSASDATLRAAYIAMELVAMWAILPLATGAFATGLVMSFGTHWGLLRHYWVVVSLALTILALAALVLQLPTITERADMARDGTTPSADLEGSAMMVLRSGAGLVILVVIIAISVFKPRGLTQYGWRKRLQERGQDAAPPDDPGSRP